MKVMNERIMISIPKVAIIKIAVSKKGMEKTRKEYEISKTGTMRGFNIECKFIFFGGLIGIFDHCALWDKKKEKIVKEVIQKWVK